MPDDPTRTQLMLRRRFHAPRNMVFRAWTDPDVLKQWFASATGSRVAVAEMDVRPGGAYRIVVVDRTERSREVHGIYQEVRPPERLVFTWNHGDFPLQRDESRVTLQFVEIDGEVEVVLTHARLSGDESVEAHIEGWTAALDSFGRYVGRLQ